MAPRCTRFQSSPSGSWPFLDHPTDCRLKSPTCLLQDRQPNTIPAGISPRARATPSNAAGQQVEHDAFYPASWTEETPRHLSHSLSSVGGRWVKGSRYVPRILGHDGSTFSAKNDNSSSDGHRRPKPLAGFLAMYVAHWHTLVWSRELLFGARRRPAVLWQAAEDEW